MTNSGGSQEALPSSFRDRDAFVFRQDGVIFRQINPAYQVDYDHLMRSGLYHCLTGEGLLIPHEELDQTPIQGAGGYRIIRPKPISFISYPYEWCFSQLQDAAVTTLLVQLKALEYGMSLKDCSGYNIQFQRGRPIFMDTSSFERYREGLPWVAYRQFCQHFLAPLALMGYADVRLGQLLRVHIDGIPLDMVTSLLPLRARLRPGISVHLTAHAAWSRHFTNRGMLKKRLMSSVSLRSLQGLVENLRSAVEKITVKSGSSPWRDYYTMTNYDEESLLHKRELVGEYIDGIRPSSVWDLGGNTGQFSRLIGDKGIDVVSMDSDPICVEENYLRVRRDKDEKVLPLVMDVVNPSPGLGWENTERASLADRGPAGAVLVLALIHHLAIGNNVPFHRIARLLYDMGIFVIIEFVPKSDRMVQNMLSSRDDVFPEYTRESFEEASRRYFVIERASRIRKSERVLYLMRRRDSPL